MSQTVNIPGHGTLVFPDGMSQADMSAAIQKNFPTIHPVKSFDAIGGKAVPVGSPEDIAAQSPVSGNSGAYNTLLGWQRGVHEIGRGIGQDLGLVSRQDVANDRALDAPLMATTGGKVGNFLGQVNAIAPAAFVPGANTVTGAAALGALSGLAQPSSSTGETLRNIGYGTAGGAGGVFAGRALGMAGKGIAGLVEPFTARGQQRIAAKTLQAFAGSPQDAAIAGRTLSTPVGTLPGVQPTTAELANSPGLTQLERTLKSTPQFATDMAKADQANRSAMVGALSDLAGTPQQMAATIQSRDAMTAPIYEKAAAAEVPVTPELKSLFNRGSVKDAWQSAQDLANEEGHALEDPETATTVSGKTVQYLKMGLDDLAGKLEQQPGGLTSNKLRLVNKTRMDLGNWITDNVPDLRQADNEFSRYSQPINQMQIGQELYNKLVPALSRFGDDTTLHADAFARALQNGDALAAKLTGNPRATLESVLSPDQMRTVNQIGEQLGRTSKAAKFGAAKGSPTAQNLASQNLMRQLLGPTGMPQSWAENIAQSTIGQTLLKPYQIVAGAAEPRITGLLQDAMRDPRQAGSLLQMTQRPSSLVQGLGEARGLLGILPQPLIYAQGQGPKQ